MKDFHVIIVGGGIGGLTLAQGLKRNGISCAVYEKDMSRADRLQGYRIYIQDFGAAGLKTCLPADLYASIKATAGQPGEGLVSLATEKLSILMAMKIKQAQDCDSFPISRIVLHRLLSFGLGDIIHYGCRFEKVEKLETGKLRVYFADGHFAEGDVLVAADGVNSAVRKQLLLEMFQPTKFGTAGIVGKVFLNSKEDITKTLDDVPPIKRGICVVGSTEGRGLFLATQIFSADAKFEITKLFSEVEGVTHEAQLPSNTTGENLLLIGGGDKKALIDDARDYVLCGYITKHVDEDHPATSGVSSFATLSQQELLDSIIVQMQMRNWSNNLVELFKRIDVNSIGYWPLSVAPNISDLSSHKAINITFVGDSIHTMPPTGGVGGNAAIRDAASLTEHLTRVSNASDIHAALEVEIPKYEKDMIQFSKGCVNTSMRNVRMITAEGYIFPYLIRMVMRIVNFFIGAPSK